MVTSIITYINKLEHPPLLLTLYLSAFSLLALMVSRQEQIAIYQAWSINQPSLIDLQ